MIVSRPRIVGIMVGMEVKDRSAVTHPAFSPQECGHFSASVLLDVEAQGGGDAGSLTPGVLPPE